VLATPLAARPLGNPLDVVRAQSARRFPVAASAALIAGPGAGTNRDLLLSGGCLAVTTGQQAGLFTGPLFSIHKALSAAALAEALAEKVGGPVVPVFWVAGDDHDFAEINHCAVLAADGQLAPLVLRERAAAAPSTPAFREPVGPEGPAALAALEAALPPSDFRAAALDWLQRAYTPVRSLAEAYAVAMAELLEPYGVVVCRGWHGELKRAALPVVAGALEQAAAIDADLAAEAGRLRAAGTEAPVEVGEGLTLVMVEAAAGRDRLRIAGQGTFTTRRSGETFTLAALRELAGREPERLSANVLLRGVVEAAVLPTVAYVGGPGELAYQAQNGPVFARLGVPRPAAVPRLAALLIEAKVDKTLEKYGLAPPDLARPAGELAGAIARESLPASATRALAELRGAIEARYAAVVEQAVAVDQTLEKTVLGARNQALAGTHDVEKKLIAAAKRHQETVLGQIDRARAQLFPGGKPQERVLTAASFLSRHGRGVLDLIRDAARAHARGYLEAFSTGF
jgi:bacillithiol biosynthesis cysteine-adding enzyme BshC